MENHIDILLKSRLFQGLTEEEIRHLLPCLDAHEKHYKKGEYILMAGNPCHQFGLVLEGRVYAFKDDFWGNRNIINQMGPSNLFAEAFACVPLPLEVSVMAAQDCKVLFLSPVTIITICGEHCSFHTKLIQNFMTILATKNLLLTKKMDHLTKRNMRQKILSYLSDMSVRAKSPYFDIPFNRQELADYLSVDRSALSAELSRLKKEGLLDYHKNSFKLLNDLNTR